MTPEQRLAGVASLALLVTMFFPWYGLQSLNRRTEAISSHNISAFGDVSFVEAAVFLVAVAVVVIVLARAEDREFHLPGGDGTIVMIAGGWAGLLIFYRVFDRPAGHGYPVGIEWGFFLAFVAAGSLAYAGLRMRTAEAPEALLTAGEGARRTARPRRHRADGGSEPDLRPRAERASEPQDEMTVIAPAPARPGPSTPVPTRGRPRYPPAPPEQLSIEDNPIEPEDPRISD
jgi:type IV secretory pathway TrbD component